MKKIIEAICIILIGIVAIIMSFSFKGKGIAGDPSLYPQLISGTLIVLGVVLLIFAIPEFIHSKKISASEYFSSINVGVILYMAIMFILLVLYMFTLQYFGYIIATVAFLFASLLFMGRGKKVVVSSAAIAVICTVVLYSTFHIALNVPLPVGALL